MHNWPVDGLEKGLELDSKEASIFFHQLNLHGMDNAFRKLYEELHKTDKIKRSNILLLKLSRYERFLNTAYFFKGQLFSVENSGTCNLIKNDKHAKPSNQILKR